MMKKFLLTAALVMATSTALNAQINSAAPEGYRARGVGMYNDCNYVGCIDQMTYLKADNPSEEECMLADFYIAMSSAHLGRTDAVGLLRHFIWRYPDSHLCNQARLAFAQILLDAGQFRRALSAYNDIELDELDSSSSEAVRYGRACCLLQLDKPQSAMPLFRSLDSSKNYASQARFYQGYIYYLDGEYAKASPLLRSADMTKAPGSMAEYYLCQIWFAQGDYDKAAQTARRLMTRDVDKSYKAEAARIAGESLYHLGNDVEAIALLNQYVEQTDNPLSSALYILGVTDYRTGRYDEAVSRLTSVASLDNALGQSANLFIGQAMMKKGNYSAAMMAFDRAMQMDYDADVRETAFYNYAVASTEGGRVPFGSTVATFEDFLRRYPDSRYAPEVEEFIITGYITDNNYQSALASINAIEKPSAKILGIKQQVLYTLGTRELAAARPTAAYEHLRQASQLRGYNPEIDAETNLWLARALYELKDYEKSANAYKSYLSNANANKANKAMGQYGYAYALFSAEKYPEALEAFRAFVSNPGTSSPTMIADGFNRIADCLYVGADFTGASESYAKAADVDPSTADYALYQQALMQGYLHDYAAKASFLESMLKRFSSSSLAPQALLELGDSYERTGRIDRAIESYSMAVARYPSSAQGRNGALMLALTYLNSGNRAQAIATYRNLISSAPTSDEARQALGNLQKLMIDDGRIDEYTAFVESIPSLGPVKADELEAAAFNAAETDYVTTGKSGRLVDYLNRFPDGASRQKVLGYALDASVKAYDNASALRYADEIIARFPDSEAMTDALRAKGDIAYSLGNGDEALEYYTRLAETASSPADLNYARINVMRTAHDLGLNDRVIEASDAITASSTISDAQRSEARFSRAMANANLGNLQAAETELSELSEATDDIFGAKAAYELAQLSFNRGDYSKARALTDRLIGSNSPHIYWIARSFILLSDINHAEGNDFEAEQYLISLRKNYPGSEADIYNMIEQRLNTIQK